MHPSHYDQVLPEELTQTLTSTWSGWTFSQRSIFVFDEATQLWVLFGCVIRPMCKDSTLAHPKYFRYKNHALLISGSMSFGRLEAFIGNLASTLRSLTHVGMSSEFWPGCERQQVPIENIWMDGPGEVYSWKAKQVPNPSYLPMFDRLAPYYPDVHEAARDWLQLREYHGQSDGRRGNVMLLLPETRAFIGNHSWADDDEHLRLQIAGSHVASSELILKGAYWSAGRITQLHASIEGAHATLVIPKAADRLEVFLMSASGTIYEQHRERLGHGGEKRFLGSRNHTSSDRVVRALKEGEGVHIEFKEFVDLPKHNEPVKEKSKLDQVRRTVAAFANAEGGTIFIGISDDLRVVGISASLAQWASGAPSLETARRYGGALRSRITDSLYLPTPLTASVLTHDQEFVVAVDVLPSAIPVSLKDEGRLWKRVGANNTRVPPAEWTPLSTRPF